jgi:hypothetical protein
VCRRNFARQRIEQHAHIPYTHGLRSVYDEFTAAIHPRFGKQKLGEQELGEQELGGEKLGKIVARCLCIHPDVPRSGGKCRRITTSVNPHRLVSQQS